MKKKEIQSKSSPIVALIIAFILGLFVGFYIPVVNKQNYQSQSQTAATNGSNVINLSAIYEDDPNDFFAAQVEAPGNYYATDDVMLTPYDTQGGSAPPRLILMKNYQVLGSENYHQAVTDNPQNDCIVIWSTKGGVNSIEDWVSIDEFRGKLSDREDIPVRTRNAVIYRMKGEESDKYVGLLIIGNKDSTIYDFQTCNTNNKADFVNVIASLKFRGDIKF